MEFIQTHINSIVTTSTLISNIVFVFLLIIIFFDKNFRLKVFSFVNKNILDILLIISLSAVIGSLAYSSILNFPPCELCWVQRIFIFPQPILLLMAKWKKNIDIVTYLLPLSIFGSIAALYQSMANFGIGSSLLECTTIGGACSKLYVLEYGYITIPFMSFSIFVYMIVVSLIYRKSQNVR
jgi:disulfide bond formation protein DsbB